MVRLLHPPRSACRLFAIGALVAIGLMGCTTTQRPAPPPPAAQKPAPNQLSADKSTFFRLPNMPEDKTPVRVGVILPFSSPSAATRALAAALMKAAELALFDSGDRDIVLISADEADPSSAATRLLNQGCEIIIGPLFGPSVGEVAPAARDRGVPVLSFSTDRKVAGDGVYLLSFQPQSEVKRIISYAASQGHTNFAALVPETAYGNVVEQSFRDSVAAAGAQVSAVERFNPSVGTATAPATTIAKTNSDAVFIGQGGAVLRGIASTLVFEGVDRSHVKFLGPGLWDDRAITREPMLNGAWFSAPEPDADAPFNAKFRDTFGSAPPQLATLAYDAVSLVALLASGTPYHRFTREALTDPNGFSGVDGIFRFNADGTLERGLAVLEVTSSGFQVVSPAPKTFQAQGS